MLHWTAVAEPRLNYLFTGLMGLAFAGAFVLPGRWTVSVSGHFQGVFSPVSRPVRWVSGKIYQRFHADEATDPVSPAAPRESAGVYRENEQLRSALASLQQKFDELSKLNADRSAVGDIRKLCRPATVTGTEGTGLREELKLSIGSSSAALFDHPVIRGNPAQTPLPCDLVGRIDRAGITGVSVRLITDPGFVLKARIARYEMQPDGSAKLVYNLKVTPIVRGVGRNQMVIANNLSMKEVSADGIQVNDLVLLDDPEWPPNIQGFTVGRISAIKHQARSALFAEISVEPQTNLMRLSEVMVMVRD